MKTAIALLLCGIVCVSASPRCSEEAFKECNPSGKEENVNVETEEQLENMCRYRNTVLQCEVDYIDRCPNYFFKDYVQNIYRMFGAFCDKSNPLRKKFLDNARCRNRIGKQVFDICEYKEVSPEDHDAFCKNVKDALKCFVQTVGERCGEDAKEAYRFALNPELHLRIVKCM